jgi:hypothetical protein
MFLKINQFIRNNQKIPLVFQHWNDDYNWWHPNTIPLDFVIHGEKRLPASHNFMWFDVGTIRETEVENNKWFSAPANKREILSEHPNVKFIKFSDIGDQKYVFPVFMPSNSYFKYYQNIGFKYVDSKILQDIRNKKAIMMFICPAEGMSGTEYNQNDFNILNSWCDEYNLPKSGVYYLHGNRKIPETNNKFTYVPTDVFPDWIDYQKDPIIPFTPDAEKHLFLCYNRRTHIHRVLIICELMRNEIIEKGIYSFGQRDQMIRSEYKHRIHSFLTKGDIIEGDALSYEFDKLCKIGNIEIDINLTENNPANSVVPDHYKKTFVSIITETLTSDKTIFFSEKIYKSIAVGHPFMVVSSPGFLKELRNCGYKTFDRWFDESYDNFSKMEDRIFAVVQEVKRLSTLSVNELISIREEMKPVLQHNQDLFFKVKKTQFETGLSDGYMYNIVKEIWNKFNND